MTDTSQHLGGQKISPIAPDHADALALRALAWIMSDQPRAERFLALTGLDADQLRGGLGDPDMLAAILGFLESHEPDLIGAAETLEIAPEILVAARRRLSLR